MGATNNKIPSGTPMGQTGQTNNITAGAPYKQNGHTAVIAALAIIAVVVLVGYYIYSSNVHPSTVVHQPVTNQTNNSAVTTTAQQTSTINKSGPMNVTGSNGVFNNSNSVQPKPPTPPASVGG